MHMFTRAALIVGTALLIARPVGAQTISLAPADPARWDVAGIVGWTTGKKGTIAADYNDWYDAFSGTLDAGHYWNAHLKTSLELTTTTEGTVYAEERIPVPGQPFPVFRQREYRYRTTSVAPSVSWQFFENIWFHPFVAGGVDLVAERERVVSRDQNFPTRPPTVLPGEADRTVTSFEARPFVTTGFKFYVAERAFIRSDVKVTANRNGVAQVMWRSGVGVDF
jgi:hypothetical protein